jgi:predicted RNA-binding Zn ribbon-like protein
VDFVRYAERAAALVNADLDDADALVRLVEDRPHLRDSLGERDAVVLRRFVDELRAVFEASNDREEQTVVDRLNQLLATHPVTPRITGHGEGWHMHVADQHSSVCDVLVAESLMGLSTLVCELGATRLGVCDAAPCTHVFVDTSPNRSRRYCSDRCSSRANVAAYRARQREAAGLASATTTTRDTA